MEIERKFLVKRMPAHLEQYASLNMEQGYLCTKPVVRVRRENDTFYLTYKGKGKMAREEANLPLTAKAYEHLLEKCDGYRIAKTRYRIPLAGLGEAYQGLTAELDLFSAPGPLRMVEVEFPTESAALSFCPPDWFGAEVTDDKRYHNAHMSRCGMPEE